MLHSVSIPRSGFCWFGPASVPLAVEYPIGVSIPRSGFCWFGLDVLDILSVHDGEVSIPRSGFCWFGPKQRQRCLPILEVSIPRSGFCWFGRKAADGHSQLEGSFNPSVGILLVWTRIDQHDSNLIKTGFNPSVGILLVWTFHPASAP